MSSQAAVWMHDSEVLQVREHVAQKELDATFHQFHGDLAFLLHEWEQLEQNHCTVQSEIAQALRQCGVRPRQLVPVMHRQVLKHLHALELEERGLDVPMLPVHVLADKSGLSNATPFAAVPSRREASVPATPSAQVPVTAADRHRRYLELHGGPTLGWLEEDHNLFVRILLRQLEPRMLLETLVDSLPQCTREDIAHHIECYAELGQLEHEKRVEMEAFRAQRHADAANERLLAELRHQAAEEQAKTEEEIAERKRRQHHAALRKKLDEWREAKRKEEQEMAQKALREQQEAVMKAVPRREPLVARPRNEVGRAAPVVEKSSPLPAASSCARAPSKVSLERRRVQDEDWLRRRQDMIAKRSLRGAARQSSPSRSEQAWPSRFLGPKPCHGCDGVDETACCVIARCVHNRGGLQRLIEYVQARIGIVV